MDLFDLFAKISLDTSSYDKGLDTASKKSSSFGSKLKSGITNTVKDATKIIAGMTAATTAFAGFLVAGAKDVASFGDEIEKNSQKVGLNYNAYQKWDYAMKISGTSMASATTGLKTLTNTFDDAQNGSKSATEKFERLGLSVDDLKGKSREDIFSAVVTALQNVEDETEKAAIANDLFGKSGQDLIPLFNMTSDELQSVMDDFDKYGMALSDDAVNASADFEDSLTKLQGTFGGLKRNLISEFLPGITTIMNGLSEIFAGDSETGIGLINSGIQNVIATITENLPKFLEIGSRILSSIMEAISENLPALVESATTIIITLVNGIVKELPQLVSAAVTILLAFAEAIIDNLPEIVEAGGQLINGIWEGIKKLWPKFKAEFDILWQDLKDKIGEIWDNIKTAASKKWEEIKKAISDKVESAKKAIADAWENIKKGAKDKWEEIKNSIYEKVEDIRDKLEKIWENIKRKATEIWDNLKKSLSDVWTNIKTTTTTIWTNIKTFVSNTWDNIKTAATTTWNNIKSVIMTPINNVKTTLSTIWENIKNTASSMWQGVKDVITNPIETVRSWLSNIWLNIKQTASSMWQNVKDEITNKLSSLPSDITNVGINMVAGLWEGIKSRLNWIKSNIGGFAGGIINKVKGLFGIASPSKVFAEIGTNLALGLGKGWADTYDKVADEIEDDLDIPDPYVGFGGGYEDAIETYTIDTDNMTSKATGASGLTTGTEYSTIININIDGANISDSNEMAETIAEKLQGLVDRRAAVWA